MGVPLNDAQVFVHGVGTALPGPPVTNEDIAAHYGMPTVWRQWVDEYIGTRSRHLAVDLATGKTSHSLTDLGEIAARGALADAGVAAGDIDVVVMSTATPDHLAPSTVSRIAGRIGIAGVPVYQLQSGCTGAVQALEITQDLLRGGVHRTALVLGGDTSAKHTSPDVDAASVPLEVQVNGLIFGDGVGAAVLGTSPAEGRPVLRHVHSRLVGAGRAPGQTVYWFGRAVSGEDGVPASEDFKAIETTAAPMAADALKHLLHELSWDVERVRYILPPQLSARMTDRTLSHLALPGAEPVSRVTEIGNTGNAIPYFQLELLLPRLRPGDRAVGISIEASKWIRSGYALELPAAV
ncbi:3-oxoacyl-ACP synthase III family protein [Streptomyces sp. NP-1717]|uniref:3-oxoacyl-ACP synthase III family protein n=1 Tax=unclassified Streptomyces TaxID=2593676 RepID=UPI001F5C5D07|nr:3-oxoacyl-ACP synthase III family protein [Streptomyces sp. NP-1717]MCI3225741.1 3-oxoacyl-ACP synthase III family protein [Streptomyces sp. NP-1717]WTA77202.1 3-oxoacyl-ACP synthase III family protein [Streptomyces sp. NBC_00838]